MNIYRAVDKRVAVDLSSFQLPIDIVRMLEILTCKGFGVEHPDIVSMLRGVVGQPAYKRGAKLKEAPSYFDCSGLSRWVYAALGVWLPRRTIQQYQEPCAIDGFDDLKLGDLLFCKGHINYWLPGQEGQPVGHVGIFVDEGSVIHATTGSGTVEDTSLSKFLERFQQIGIRRPVEYLSEITTLSWSDDREVETSDDIYWTLFQEVL